MASPTPLAQSARRRTQLVAGALVLLLAGVVGVAIAAHRSAPPTADLGPVVPGSVPVAARFPVTTSSARPRPPTTSSRTPPTTQKSTVPSTTSTPVPLVFVPPASGPPPTRPPAPPTTAVPTFLLGPAISATVPPPPPAFGASALTWTAPATLEIPADTTTTLSVTAHNPTVRNVDMPHPLSCTPRLDHAEACTQIVQRIAAHASASATYVIDAHDIVPGDYTLTIEGVLTIAVTVT